jgi:hypothetical protein
MGVNQTWQNSCSVQVDYLSGTREPPPRCGRGPNPGDPICLNGDRFSCGFVSINGNDVSID